MGKNKIPREIVTKLKKLISYVDLDIVKLSEAYILCSRYSDESKLNINASLLSGLVEEYNQSCFKSKIKHKIKWFIGNDKSKILEFVHSNYQSISRDNEYDDFTKDLDEEVEENKPKKDEEE